MNGFDFEQNLANLKQSLDGDSIRLAGGGRPECLSSDVNLLHISNANMNAPVVSVLASTQHNVICSIGISRIY